MTRGEIWWVDFGVPLGSEVGFRRPVIVLQNNRDVRKLQFPNHQL